MYPSRQQGKFEKSLKNGQNQDIEPFLKNKGSTSSIFMSIKKDFIRKYQIFTKISFKNLKKFAHLHTTFSGVVGVLQDFGSSVTGHTWRFSISLTLGLPNWVYGDHTRWFVCRSVFPSQNILTLFRGEGEGVIQSCITLNIFFNTVKAQICTHSKLFDF